MLKKILILILALALIAVSIFFFFYKPSAPETEGESVNVGNFFPSGENSSTTTGTSTNNDLTNPDGSLSGSSLSRLRQISQDPTSGAGIVRLSNKSLLRYIDKATGHIFETPVETIGLTKISNTTIPKIYESVWTENGSGVVIRYLKEDRETIESFYAKLKSATTTGSEDGVTPQTLEGTFLPQQIKTIAVSPQKTNIFYISETEEGSVGIESLPNGNGKKELFRSPLKEWLVSWPKADTLTLTTKPSAGISGILYFFNKTKGRLDKILRAPSLTTLTSPDATQVLYGENTSGLTTISIYAVSTKQNISFPLATLPEKCLWSSTEKAVVYCAVPRSPLLGDLPDVWYQGLVSFSDDIWKVNLDTGETTRLSSPETEARVEIDAINLFTTATEDYLFFTNKKDDSLWSVRLTTFLES